MEEQQSCTCNLTPKIEEHTIFSEILFYFYLYVLKFSAPCQDKTRLGKIQTRTISCNLFDVYCQAKDHI